MTALHQTLCWGWVLIVPETKCPHLHGDSCLVEETEMETVINKYNKCCIKHKKWTGTVVVWNRGNSANIRD